MNWKQTIGLVLAVGLIVALSFALIFPAIYESQKPETDVEAGEESPPPAEGDKDVLPKLKGVNWKAPERKVPEKKAEKKTLAEPKIERPGALAEETVTDAVPRPSLESLLELQDVTWSVQGNYILVMGSVKNISSRSLPSVRVHAIFLDEAQRRISSEHSLIDLNPIFPGQVSSFMVTARFTQLMNGVALDFRKFSGVSIPWSKLELEEEPRELGAEEAAQEALEAPPDSM